MWEELYYKFECRWLFPEVLKEFYKETKGIDDLLDIDP